MGLKRWKEVSEIQVSEILLELDKAKAILCGVMPGTIAASDDSVQLGVMLNYLVTYGIFNNNVLLYKALAIRVSKSLNI